MKYFFIITFSVISLATYAQPRTGSLAPDISLPDANGKLISLSSLKGKVVLLDFWASWCRPCRISIKENEPVYEKYSSKGFEIFGVSIDGNTAPWLNAIKQDESNWLQVIDTHAEYGNQLTKTWNLQMIPSTFLIDKEGKIVASNLEKDKLEKWLERLL